jgi:alpha-glutamyl/putrescinyl thymine pyrophosphorylase clade 1
MTANHLEHKIAAFPGSPGRGRPAVQIRYPVPYYPEHFLTVMAARAARGAKLYGPAYTIHADNTSKGRCTAEYQAAEVFNPLWRKREFLRPTQGETLARYFARLSECHGLRGGFMPAQIIADLKYVAPLSAASDWMTFAASGPGSRRGLNRVLGRPVDAPWSESGWRREFDRLRTAPTWSASGWVTSTPKTSRTLFVSTISTCA